MRSSSLCSFRTTFVRARETRGKWRRRSCNSESSPEILNFAVIGYNAHLLNQSLRNFVLTNFFTNMNKSLTKLYNEGLQLIGECNFMFLFPLYLRCLCFWAGWTEQKQEVALHAIHPFNQ